MAVTIIRGAILSTATGTVRNQVTKTNSPLNGSPQNTIANSLAASQQLGSTAAISLVRATRGSLSGERLREHAEAEITAQEVADQIRTDEEQGEEAHSNLDPTISPNGLTLT